MHHLVEANLDIESRGDRSLCTEVLQGERRYEVLTNQHLHNVCMICAAILDRRISNMPKERKTGGLKVEYPMNVPKSQLCLLTVSLDFGEASDEQEPETEEDLDNQQQIELFF